jgi:2',5'-phosphodiesterase
MGEIRETAYLRELTATKQCELMFALKVDIESLGTLQEEVRAVRQLTDTVESLLQHIMNKIKHSIKVMKEQRSDCENKEVKINITLKKSSSRKHINPKMVLHDLINSTRNMEFQVFTQRFFVVVNAPLVKEMKLPLILYCNYSVQPIRLSMLFAENSVCQYSWYKSEDKLNWTKVANTYKYTIDDADIGHYLKLVCVPCNSILTGPPAEIVSENKVERMGTLPTCPFEERHRFTTEKLDKNNFRVVSYNILSNRYTEAKEQFPYCSPQTLAIDYRKQLIAKELTGYQADIICLQEVDSAIYTSYYKNEFKSKGYQSFYHRKGNKIPEGLTCFFNKSRFKKVDDHQIIYSTLIKNKSFTYLFNFVKSNVDLKESFMKQLTSLQVTVLKLAWKKNEYIVLANTHLFYHPDAELVRILQVNIATTYLSSLCGKYSQNGEKVRLIFCGDFNSVPTSPVYEYMMNKRIERSHRIFEKTRNNIDLSHNFQFESAYGKPKYTNYTDDFKDCLDYIFVEKNKIKVDKVVPLPTEEELSQHQGLPNDVFPSDHLALVTDLELV